MIKPDHWIIDFGKNGGIEPFCLEQVNPASYDVTLGDNWICPTREPESFTADQITLFPGEVILATTSEYISLPRDVVADLRLKSTIGRLWINHSLSAWINCNFKGKITLELQNLGPHPRVLTKGMRVAQFVFMQMESPPTVAYGEDGKGHYQGQGETRKAWSEDMTPISKENTDK